jgi:hypothetical protein
MNDAIRKATPAEQMQPINAETMAPPGVNQPSLPPASAETRLPAPKETGETPSGDPELPLDNRNA